MAPLGTAPNDVSGHGQETSAPNLSTGPLPAQGLLRARAVSNRCEPPVQGVKVKGSPGGGGLRADHRPAQGRGLGPPGAPAPQVHGHLPRHRHDGFLLRRLAGLGVAQHGPPARPQFGVALPEHQPPGQLDQRRAQPHVAVLGDGQLMPAVPAGAHAPTRPGVAAHLPPVGEAVPLADCAFDHGVGQAA